MTTGKNGESLRAYKEMCVRVHVSFHYKFNS